MNYSELLKKNWVRIISICIILFAVFISFLPVGIKYFIEDWYKDQGAESVQIDDVDFNLFSGEMGFEGIKVTLNSETVLSLEAGSVNVSWIGLLSKKINIEEISLKKFFLDVDNNDPAQMIIGGIKPGGGKEQKAEEKNQSKDENSAWGFGLTKVSLGDFRIKYTDQKITSSFTLHDAQLNNVLTWTPDNHAILALSGEINESPVSISAEIKPFSKKPEIKARLKIENLDLEKFKEVVKPGLTDLSGKLFLETNVDVIVETEKFVQVNADGEYRLENCNIELPGSNISLNQLQIKGPFDIRQMLQDTEEEKTAINFSGELAAKSIVIKNMENQIKLLELGRLHLKNIEINKLSSIKVAETLLDDFRFGSESSKDKEPASTPVIAAKSIQLVSTKLSEFNFLEIQKISLQRLVSDLAKNKEGKLVVLSKLTQQDETQKTESKKPEIAAEGEKGEPKESFKFKIGAIDVSEKSRVSFKDESTIPRFETVLDIKKIAVSNVDNTDVNSSSDILLNGKIGKYGAVNVAGKIKLFAAKKDFSIDSNIKSYDLPPLSSYTSQLLGYNLTSGQGDAKINAIAKKGVISGEAKIVFNNLTVDETDPEHMKKLNEQLSIPLGMALSLLRDSNDDIKLKIPITGDLFKPDVGVGDIINTALGNALKGATMAYLKYAFQPFGTLISIVQVAGKAAGSIQLDPVNFAAGDSALDDESSGYLQKIAELVQGRKGIRIKLCGISVEEDRTTLLQQKIELAKNSKGAATKDSKNTVQPNVTNDELFALAKDRAEVIKHQLVTQFKIDPARLFVCHPEIKKEDDAKPSVELLI
ncbi:DUF748 domain-containing protein [Kaarinaea lacus]